MIPQDLAEAWQGPSIALPVAAELQDDLLAAANDLDRLQGLVRDACDTLMAGFSEAASASDQVRGQLAEAMTALQFGDMASQLIAHTSLRLRRCSDRVAQHALAAGTAGDEEGEGSELELEFVPMRPNPVTQEEMDAGSIELF
jgi:hypothetical protein